MSYRVVQDRDLCDGHAQCVLAAPSVFAIGDADNVSHVLSEHPSAGELENVKAAVDRCPKGALSVAYDEG
jgi:ferredoxin